MAAANTASRMSKDSVSGSPVSAIWVSADGVKWVPVSARGLAGPVETITGLAKDSWGFLATGTAQSGTGLVWTSPTGLNWHRFTAAQFGLVNVPGEQVFAMTDAASDWNVTLIVGWSRTANHRDPVTPPHLAGGEPGVLPGEFRPKGDPP